jgi:hypothetical protein
LSDSLLDGEGNVAVEEPIVNVFNSFSGVSVPAAIGRGSHLTKPSWMN